MPDKFKISTAILAIAFIHETQVTHRQKQMEYLGDKLDANDIPVTEFDRIAMNNLM